MYIHVVSEYQLWANRGYLTKYTCKHHPYMDLIVSADHEGIFILCPFDDYKHHFSFSEYKDIESKVKYAKLLFKEQ